LFYLQTCNSAHVRNHLMLGMVLLLLMMLWLVMLMLKYQPCPNLFEISMLQGVTNI
jgi:hypothetical protein